MDNSSKERFSNRVANYVRYRPGYPDAVATILHEACALGDQSVVADVGAGTGISTELLLRLGCTVNAVEPNNEMRAAAEAKFGADSRFHSIRGAAEATTLDAHSQDCVFAAQAFHWFDQTKTRNEFKRILKPTGAIAFCWNERLTSQTPFLEAYETLLLDYATDYEQVDHSQVGIGDVNAFMESECDYWEFDNSQTFDYEGLRGRLLSSSYAPTDGPNFQPMLKRLREVFDCHQEDGVVHFLYKTTLYVGRFAV